MTKSYRTMIQNASPNFSNTNFKTFIWCHGESRVWMLSFQPSKLAVTRLGTRRVVNLLGNEPRRLWREFTHGQRVLRPSWSLRPSLNSR
jgi:hypothetical protein